MAKKMRHGRIGSNKSNKEKAQIRERKLAERLGGKSQPNSGATDAAKGDIKIEKFLIDDKFTGTKGYTLKKEDLDKISREARGHNREPMMILKFTKNVPKGMPSEWAIFPARLYEEEVSEEVDIRGKSTFLTMQILNTLNKRCLKHDKEVSRILRFFKTTLGVDRDWVLTPLDDLQNKGYFI